MCLWSTSSRSNMQRWPRQMSTKTTSNSLMGFKAFIGFPKSSMEMWPLLSRMTEWQYQIDGYKAHYVAVLSLTLPWSYYHTQRPCSDMSPTTYHNGQSHYAWADLEAEKDFRSSHQRQDRQRHWGPASSLPQKVHYDAALGSKPIRWHFKHRWIMSLEQDIHFDRWGPLRDLLWSYKSHIQVWKYTSSSLLALETGSRSFSLLSSPSAGKGEEALGLLVAKSFHSSPHLHNALSLQEHWEVGEISNSLLAQGLWNFTT